MEKYLEILPDRRQRKSLAAFRISAHKLQIERGRYVRKNVEDRLCNSCNKIDDEIHLLCKCVKYQSLRNNMFDNIYKSFNVVMSIRGRVIIIMTSTEENTVKSLGLFVALCDIS